MLKKPQKLGLFNDTEMLSHTRGVPLLNVFKLIWLLSQSSGLYQQVLAQKAQEIGIKEFQNFHHGKPMPTRTRHYWYTLERLELVTKERMENNHFFYQLSEKGQNIALSIQNLPEKAQDISSSLRRKMGEVVRRSKYVNDTWLSFASTDQKTGFILESLSSNSIQRTRYQLSIYGSKYVKWKDSGYRIYPPDNRSDWKNKCVFYGQQDEQRVTGFILSDTARKEMIEGIRGWCHKLNITFEVPISVSSPWKNKHVNNRVKVGIILQELPNELVSIEDVLNFVEQIICEQGDGKRIRIPGLINILCTRFNISVTNTKNILTEIQKHYSHRLYFEGASRSVVDIKSIKTRRNSFDYYLNIGGIWRTTIRLLSK